MRTKSLIYTFLTILAILIIIFFTIQKNIFETRDELKKIIKDKYPNISLLRSIFKKQEVTSN